MPPKKASAGAEEAAPDYLGHRQRLKARFYAGPEALQDYELLELLLTFAIPRRDTKSLAKSLLREFGTFGDVLGADPARLEEFDLSPNVVALLKTTYAAAARVAKPEPRKRSALSSMDAVIEYCT